MDIRIMITLKWYAESPHKILRNAVKLIIREYTPPRVWYILLIKSLLLGRIYV
jgi:hypothetical protein